MAKDNKDLHVQKRIKEIFKQNYCRYGYKRITLELNKEVKINHKKVKRIMKVLGLFAIRKKNINPIKVSSLKYAKTICLRMKKEILKQLL